MIETLSKNKFNYIKSLQQSKFRQKYRKFVVEGQKSVADFLKSKKFFPEYLITTENDWDRQNDIRDYAILLCRKEEMAALSNLVTPTPFLAVFDMVDFDLATIISDNNPLIILDGIQDPGNCGTIIRAADWFGFKNILRTTNTADFYHPKVVQASMGSLNNIQFSTLTEVDALKGKKVMGMDMNGNNLENLKLEENLAFVLGSEGNGISDELKLRCDTMVSIAGADNRVAESLNVGVAAGILLFHLSRKRR